MKRIFLFLLTNIAIMLVITIIINIFGLGQVLDAQGVDLDLTSLLMLSAVVGGTGSFISLAMSKSMAKHSTGAYVITQPQNEQEQWLINTVSRQAQAAGIGMPEVAIYDSPDINAFATGMLRNDSLVAVSTGLLRGMTRDEAEAVLAHEVSHVANGDMITLTLIQGVLNTFVFFFARIAASAINRGSNNHFVYFMTVMAFQVVFGMLASIVVMWFSRQREYRADAGGAELAGKQKMIAALQKLQSNQAGGKIEGQLDGQLTAFGISGGRAMGSLFMSHPPLQKRIDALRGRTV